MSTFASIQHAPTSLTAPVHTTQNDSSLQHTKQPIVTGTSVLAIKYCDGVMISADTLCSYGSMAKYKDARRIRPCNANTLIGAGGEYSDFQSIMDMLSKVERADLNFDDNGTKEPSEIWSMLRATMYQRRNKMDPLWNELVVGGYSKVKGEGFLGESSNY